MIETITWIPVAERLPDVDTTVMLYVPRYAKPDMEPTWPGYHDGDMWRTAEGIPVHENHITHWAAWPKGPRA